VTLGQVGFIDEGQEHILELLNSKPDFLSRSREVMKILIVNDEYNEMHWDGLHKAGLV